jgi:hypothetical protein
MQLANITQSLNPSVFIRVPQNLEKAEQEEMYRSVNKGWGGVRKTGIPFMVFGATPELTPTIEQLEPAKLDKAFLQLNDTIQRQIAYSHHIDPVIMGLKTPGSLGDSSQLPIAISLFQNSEIKPAQKNLEGFIKNLALLNGISIDIKLNEFKLLDQ